jgi:4-amino-4-deoxy-L-arabinose transferase-like glycosyltransferase
LLFLDRIRKSITVSKWEYMAFFIMIVVASFLRLWDLSAVGFNNDEAIYSGQAATLAGFDEFQDHFSIFRAHPLLLQFILSILFSSFSISDTVARVVPAVFGVLIVILTYLIGRTLFDRNVAIFSAVVISLLPYHIIISRQVLLDVPLSFFTLLAFFFITSHMKSPKVSLWLYLIGASAGLSFLSKEIGIFTLVTSIVSLFLIRTFSFKNLTIIMISFILASSPYWIPIATIQEAQNAFLAYWYWQTSREPNQPDTFYLKMLSQEALGYVLFALAIVAIAYSFIKKIINPVILLLLLWIGIPLIVLHTLDVKGYHFLFSIVPFFVVLGISFFSTDLFKKVPKYGIVAISIIALIFAFSGPPLHFLFQIPPINLVGSGGEPYSREAAIWIRDNIPSTATFLTLDTRTANVIKFYSNNDAFSLHANKNPAYEKIDNSDFAVLSGKIDYLVLESHLAERLPYLKQEAIEIHQLVQKFNGSIIHTEYKSQVDNKGENTLKPAVIIYSLNSFKENN